MGDEVRFGDDLYVGVGEDYQRYRPSYPSQLLGRLVEAAGVSGQGRLLDLACGTGQVAMGLAGYFHHVLAVDQEPDMVRVGRLESERLGLSSIEWRLCAVEDLALPSGGFEVVTAGNAFHRLPRWLVARKVLEWLRPGGCFALLWGGVPVQEDLEWQQTVRSICERWMDLLGSRHRIPAGWQDDRNATPDAEILRQAGFERIGRIAVETALNWTAEALAGFWYSTSLLSRSVLGDKIAEFEADLRDGLIDTAGTGPYRQVTEFGCDLAFRPVSGVRP